jgi:DNA-binding LytR/AlgR family response regulator
MIRALVVDDEEPARGELRYLLSAHPEVDVVGEAASAGEALALAEKVRYDVVFLDVELPGMTGLEVARLVLERSEHPEVVFVTAHQRYAVDAFAVEAFDYLVKPVEPERLARVVERLSQARKRQRPEVEKIAVVSAGGAQTLLDYDAVYWIEADGDYSRVHTFDRPYLSTSSLRELAELLS